MGEQPNEWAEPLAREHAWVLQIPHRVIGRVSSVGWVAGSHTPTIKLEEGHTFHAIPENFVVLTAAEVAAYRDMVGVVRTMVGALARRAADAGMQQPTFEVLCGVVLSAQLAALGRIQQVAPQGASDG
jgi:hypothetical protein